MLTNLSIIGSGGHAKVVVDSLSCFEDDYQIYIFDEITKEPSNLLNQFPIQILNNFNDLTNHFHVAIGQNDVRERISLEAIKHGKKPLSLVHQFSVVSSNAIVQEGVFIAANAIIAASAIIESGCIINHAAIIDHDCSVGEYSHIAPNATLGGGVSTGRRCLVGSGAIILPNITVGDYAVIGAGSVVTKDVPKGVIMAGNPAREIN